MKMKLIIETEIDPEQGSATFDTIANDEELRELVEWGRGEWPETHLMTRLRAMATDIVVHGRGDGART